nr:calcium-binding protein [Microvirga terricola]
MQANPWLGGTISSIQLWSRAYDHKIVEISDFNIALADFGPALDSPAGPAGLLFGGDDSVVGGTGQDALFGGGGDDTIRGGAGDDDISPGWGSDIVDGGDGFDYVGYGESDKGVNVDLGLGTVFDPWGSIDRLISIEGVSGTAYNDTLTGNNGNNGFYGEAGNDSLSGLDGDDLFSPGRGADTILGGSGFDTIMYSDYAGTGKLNANLSTGIVIDPWGDTDHVSGIERVRGTGNDDTVIGSNADETFEGLGGADSFDGGGGNDTVSYARDKSRGGMHGVTVDLALGTAKDGFGTTDTFVRVENATGTDFNDVLHGNALANVLTGNAGNDFLDGRDGADTLKGGLGDDTFYVDRALDVVVEFAGEGTDTVYASASYTLSLEAEVEVLRTIDQNSSQAINLTGSSFANKILGNTGNNVLNGMGGADTMAAFAGNDTYYVDDANDQVIESASGGHDIIYASASFTLGASVEVEYLEAIGSGRISLTGNALANTLVGNAGSNRLSGGGGRDILTGGAGKDTFVFDVKLSKANLVQITDFNVKDDTIQLAKTIFSKIAKKGTLASGAFWIGSKAHEADDRIIYNKKTGALLYDADGSGKGAAIQIATISKGLGLTHKDFFVI